MAPAGALPGGFDFGLDRKIQTHIVPEKINVPFFPPSEETSVFSVIF